MAVIPMWLVDRDNSMHASKSEADKHDQMLEIADHFATAVRAVADIPQAEAEAIGLFLAKNREAVAKLCKGSNESLAAAIEESNASSSVTPLRAAQ